MSAYQKSLYLVYVGILLISASYFLQDFNTTHNYMEAWLMQWVSLRQWVLCVPGVVLGMLIAKEEYQ